MTWVSLSNVSVPGWRTVVGGFLIHLVLGTLYCWANITSAVTSRLHAHNQSITYKDTINIYAVELIAQGSTMMLGGLLSQRIGCRRCCALASILLISATFGSSLSDNFASLMFCQGILFGMGIGIAYTAPIATAAYWIPERKGMCTGLIMSGFGLGALIFGLIATHVVNPHQQSVEADGDFENYFPPSSEVVRNVPKMYRTLGICYCFVLSLGTWLLCDRTADAAANSYEPCVDNVGAVESIPKELNNENDDDIEIEIVGSPLFGGSGPQVDAELGNNTLSNESPAALESVRSHVDLMCKQSILEPIAWHIAVCFVLTTVGGMYLAGTFKTFGQEEISDELFLSSIAAVSSVFNSMGRICWGFLSDRFSALTTLHGLSFIFSFLIVTFPYCVHFGKPGFAMWTFMLFFFEGGNFVLYFPIVVQCFGSQFGASNYGLVFSFCSVFIMVTITTASQSGKSFELLSFILGLTTFAGFLCSLMLRKHMKFYSTHN